MAGNTTVKTCGNIFQSSNSSSNYGVDNNGDVGMYVEECDRSWASSSRDNDHQAITIEVANCGGSPDWEVSDIALEKTIDLCVDICERNGIEKLIYTGDETGNLTRHNMFANTTCPGSYLQAKFDYIADSVNARLLANAEEPTVSEMETVYTVVANDTLTSIAKKHDTTVAELAELNDITNWNLIYIGQKLKIPVINLLEGVENITYTIVKGDTLSAIAEKYGTTYQELAKINNISNPDLIYPGQIIIIE